MNKLLRCFAIILFAFILAFSINTSSNANISGGCDTECLGLGYCEDNPEGGIGCKGSVRSDGFPLCENSPCVPT